MHSLSHSNHRDFRWHIPEIIIRVLWDGVVYFYWKWIDLMLENVGETQTVFAIVESLVLKLYLNFFRNTINIWTIKLVFVLIIIEH